MDLLGPEPKIDLEAWGMRTNLEHRDIGDRQPVKIGAHGSPGQLHGLQRLHH